MNIQIWIQYQDHNERIYNLSSVGEVKAEGITVRELHARIKSLLEKDYLTTAQVLVFIEQYRIKQVSVIGEVNTPGKYDMTAERDTTLLEAIALAGGFTKDANENGTKIIRVRDGKTRTIEARVSDIKKGRIQDVVIEPEDIISVPESFF
jgi:polysaccharide export outer membrane protein